MRLSKDQHPKRPAAAMNVVDRVVNFFNPMKGRERFQARAQVALASGYAAARRDRRATSQWNAVAASADADTLPDLDLLRARSRDLVRNDPLAQSAISTKVVNVIGTGHTVLPEIDADYLQIDEDAKDAWERQAQIIWTNWAQSPDCDITRTQNFAALEDLVYRSRLQSGDVLAIRRYKRRKGRLLGSAVQVVEADRLSNSDMQMDSETLAGGVETDADGAPTYYHVADHHRGEFGFAKATKWKRIPAFGADGRRLVLHIHGPRWRPDMTRYAPLLAPVIESLKQRSRYTEAELMAAVVSACFAVGIKSPEGNLGATLPGEEGSAGASSASKDIRITEPGQIFDLMPDEEVQSFEPGRPNPAYEPFVDAIAREIGAGTDLPHELLMKSFKASYSASRAALEMAWQFFRVDRAHHIDQFCRPFYEDVIGEAVARGLLSAPGFFTDPLARQAWLGSVWIGPARPTIDPVKDATADEKYLAMGVTTRTRIAAERFAGDYRQIAARRRAEDADLAGVSATPDAGTAPGNGPDDPDDDDDDTDLEDE